MKVYLIRHGQSEANIKHYFGGQMQVELTEEGRKQAKKLGEIIQGIHFDKVYSSDLHRAIDTQKIALHEAKCEITPLLREIDVGTLAGLPLSKCTELYGEELSLNRLKYNFAPYGGEDCTMLKNRIAKFFDQIINEGHETVAAFCHGALISVAFEYILGIEIEKSKIEIKNCSISIFDYRNGKWKIDLLNFTGEL